MIERVSSALQGVELDGLRHVHLKARLEPARAIFGTRVRGERDCRDAATLVGQRPDLADELISTCTWPPGGVNLIALESRFQTICCTRPESPMTRVDAAVNAAWSCTPFASAPGRRASITVCTIGPTWIGCRSIRTLPVMMRDTSSRSSARNGLYR